MHKLKILFIAGWYPTKQCPVGGVFVKEHAKAAAIYNDITVLYAEASISLQGKRCDISDVVEDGIRTIRIRYPKTRIPKTHTLIYVWHILRAFRKLLKDGWRPDIIHAHVYSAGEPALIIGKLFRIPVVVTEHFTNFATHSLTPRQEKKARFAMSRAEVILPVSEDLKESICNYYGIKNRFRVIPNVVNTRVFFPSGFRSKNINHDRKKRMLCVCILTPRKGIDYLLESLSQLKEKRQDFVLDIVGDGPNRKAYEELVRNLGLSDTVTFHGRQPEVANFMRRCDFFVLPSLYENFGVVYIEAMACGKPVIGTNAGGPKEIISEETGILVPPKDTNALAEAIDCMLDHYQNYSPHEISQYVKERYSYEAVGKKLDSIYREIVTNKTKSRQ